MARIRDFDFVFNKAVIVTNNRRLQIDIRQDGHVEHHFRRVHVGSSQRDRHPRASDATGANTNSDRHCFQRRGLPVCVDHHRLRHTDSRRCWYSLHLRVLVQVSELLSVFEEKPFSFLIKRCKMLSNNFYNTYVKFI